MKYKANGGYQILNFEGVDIASITSLDFKKIKDAILREKTFQIIGLSPQTDVKANANCEVSYDSDNDVCIIKVLDNTIVVSNDNSVVVSPIEYGTSVEANVQLVGDEPNLSSIQIGDDKYKVSQVSPSTSQIYDEEIDKLKIDGTIYKIGGSKLYKHNIAVGIFLEGETRYIQFEPIYSTKSTAYSKHELYEILKSTYFSWNMGGGSGYLGISTKYKYTFQKTNNGVVSNYDLIRLQTYTTNDSFSVRYELTTYDESTFQPLSIPITQNWNNVSVSGVYDDITEIL